MTVNGFKLNEQSLRDYCAKWKIKELAVFGSVLRNDFRADSDVDFLVEFEDGARWDLFDHFDMEEELAEIVGRNVDLVRRSSIEASRNRFRKKEILSTAEPVIAKG